MLLYYPKRYVKIYLAYNRKERRFLYQCFIRTSRNDNFEVQQKMFQNNIILTHAITVGLF